MRYYILVVAIILVSSCVKKTEVPLNEKEFTNLLIDVHLTDAILGIERYNGIRGIDENKKYYNHLFDKYGITSADFDSCVIVYSKNLIDYDRIYQVVVDSLNHLKSGYDRELKIKLERDTLNLWTCKKFYSFPTDSANMVECSIPFNERGMYSLSLRVKIKKGDKGINNKITGYFVRKSKVGHDSIIPFDTINLRKDTIWRYYNIHKFVRDSNYSQLHFKILDCDNIDSLINRNAEIKSIKVVNPLFEGSMSDIEKFPRR